VDEADAVSQAADSGARWRAGEALGPLDGVGPPPPPSLLLPLPMSLLYTPSVDNSYSPKVPVAVKDIAGAAPGTPGGVLGRVRALL